MTLPAFLLAETRRRILFDSDNDCHRIARTVSDAVEHGLQNFGALRPHSRQVVVQTARYLRTALLRLAGADAATLNTLLAPPYKEPVGPLNLIKYLRGRILGNGGAMAPSGHDHPHCDWNTNLDRVHMTDGKYTMQFTDDVTARVADGVIFQPTSREVWDGSRIQEQPLPQLKKG